MKTINIQLPMEKIETFCKKWKLKEFSIFGSVLRDDFRPDSDVDVLVSFLPGHEMTFEDFIDMRDELSAIFAGHEIDLTEKQFLINPFRRHEILTTRKVVYAA